MRRNMFSKALNGFRRSALFEKASLFLGMYVVTVSLFWFETGMLSKGLFFGVIAASLKTALARGHAKMFADKCEPPAPGDSTVPAPTCEGSSTAIVEPTVAFREIKRVRQRGQTELYDDMPWGPASPCPPTLQAVAK